jgi:hypothetical protein
MARVKARLATARYSSAENRRGVTVYNTFGWTPAVSINPMPSSFRKLLTRCFAGTSMRLSATFICQMFRDLEQIRLMGLTRTGNRHFGKAHGSHEAGLCKSLLRRHQSRTSWYAMGANCECIGVVSDILMFHKLRHFTFGLNLTHLAVMRAIELLLECAGW